MLRLYQLITVICIIVFPRSAVSWGSKEEEEPAKVDDVETDKNEADVPSGDPLIDGFPNLVKWFRGGGGISKLRCCTSYTCYSYDMLKSFISIAILNYINRIYHS